MAVDTRDKRTALLGIGSPVPSVFPNPAGTIEAADRSQFLYLYSGIAAAEPAAPTVHTPAFTIRETLLRICSHISASGYVSDCQISQAKQLDIGNRIGANVWIESRRVAVITLGKTSTAYDITVRFHRNMLADPVELTEFSLAETVSNVSEDLLGDFDLGSTVRNIDVGGEFGRSLRARWGYVKVSGLTYRIADLFLPVVVNDTSTLTK